MSSSLKHKLKDKELLFAFEEETEEDLEQPGPSARKQNVSKTKAISRCSSESSSEDEEGLSFREDGHCSYEDEETEEQSHSAEEQLPAAEEQLQAIQKPKDDGAPAKDPDFMSAILNGIKEIKGNVKSLKKRLEKTEKTLSNLQSSKRKKVEVADEVRVRLECMYFAYFLTFPSVKPEGYIPYLQKETATLAGQLMKSTCIITIVIVFM